mgnify:CR=1 FL=1
MEFKATGNSSSEVGTPWADTWNDVKASVGKTVEAVVEPVKQAVEGPWTRMWGGTREAPKKAPVAPPSGSTSLSGDWDAINKNYSQGQPERDKAQLEILNTELLNEKDPANIKILKREIARAIKGSK